MACREIGREQAMNPSASFVIQSLAWADSLMLRPNGKFRNRSTILIPSPNSVHRRSWGHIRQRAYPPHEPPREAAVNTFTKVALKGCAGLMVGIVGSVSCLAIDYQPGDWVPLPPDTGVLMSYY